MSRNLIQRIQSLLDQWAGNLADMVNREPQRTRLYWRNNTYQYENGTSANLQRWNISGEFYLCELDADRIAISQLEVPAGAEQYLPGIVANKLPQISPWEISNLLYGYIFHAAAQNTSAEGENGGTLTIAMANAGQLSLGPDNTPIEFKPNQMRYETLSKSGELIELVRADVTTSGNNFGLTGRIKLALSATAFAGVLAWTGGQALDFWQDNRLQLLVDRQMEARSILAGQITTDNTEGNPLMVLAAFRDATPSRLVTLETLAIILGDGVYIESLQIDADTVRFTARAEDAAATLRDVADSDMFTQEAFSGSITRQKGSSQLRFEISAWISNTAAAGLDIKKLLAARDAKQ